MDDLYKLLNENYVEDDDNMFRFDYSRPFLRWALTPPNFFVDWHIGGGSQHPRNTNASLLYMYRPPAVLDETDPLC